MSNYNGITHDAYEIQFLPYTRVYREHGTSKVIFHSLLI